MIPVSRLHDMDFFLLAVCCPIRQDKYDNFFFVVDLHAITVPQDPKQLKEGVITAAATYLAAGIDPEKSKVFVQVRYCSVRSFWER